MQPDPNASAMALLGASVYHGRGMGAVALAFSMEDMHGDGANLYQYLGSNPWMRSDPLGLSWDPFDMVDEYMAKTAGAQAAFLNQLGQNARATAVVAATIASFLPFPFVGNLRASRQTELAASFPLHTVCAWIGNTKAIAAGHYLQVTDAD